LKDNLKQFLAHLNYNHALEAYKMENTSGANSLGLLYDEALGHPNYTGHK
jgi:hypothetical protein